MGLPPISTIGLGRTPLSSLIRVPYPPARITTFIFVCFKLKWIKSWRQRWLNGDLIQEYIGQLPPYRYYLPFFSPSKSSSISFSAASFMVEKSMFAFLAISSKLCRPSDEDNTHKRAS